MACLKYLFAYFAVLAIASFSVHAADPTQLQDFCVGVTDPNNALFVNGMFCKNPEDVTADDFLLTGLDKPRSTNSRLGSNVTLITPTQLPGLNTLGVAIARVDYAPFGLNPPHTHPRATELFTVMEGTFYVGFVTSNLPNGGNKFFTKVLNKGDVFAFPQGLIHFQFNIGNTPAMAMSALSSQNPGLNTIANAVFASEPSISVDVLSKAFQLDGGVIKYLESRFAISK
ncbi:germin-like protein [Silene latifolia]|uniref:germin-like protein n=1 Tax=Silene latifolia TaxID=37657 RepID=UPI003D78872B